MVCFEVEVEFEVMKEQGKYHQCGFLLFTFSHPFPYRSSGALHPGDPEGFSSQVCMRRRYVNSDVFRRSVFRSAAYLQVSEAAATYPYHRSGRLHHQF
jgi:hypothetical protein